MISKLMRFQLIAFFVIAVLGIVYVGGKYARLDNLVGIGQYTVHMNLKESGGIFPNAEISYRGVPVGRVGEMRVTEAGLVVDLKLDSGGPDIPESTRAVVANRSAIGEQFVDFLPESESGPFLKDGSTINSDQTSTPVPIEDLFGSVSALTGSIPVDALHTTFTELGAALNGRGGDLASLVDSVNLLTEAGHEALPQTLSLITDSVTVLGTQAAQGSAIQSFSSDLDRITAQLKSSDPDVRALIGTAQDASTQIGDFVATSGNDITALLVHTDVITKAADDVWEGLRVLLAALPALGAAAPALAPGDGAIHMGVVLETNNPVPCSTGYEGTQQILAEMKAQNPNFDDTTDDFPVNLDARCAVPVGNPSGVRSSDRIALADPDIVQPWDNKPKQFPDTLYLRPIASQLATVMGVTPR
ncbi:MCE family protein [Tomitella biformata]|uniref:MCE family protein n=1 Tax=Tomitella biformata TaxID=630403 RepID=UPI0004634FE8|nr:MCE family protein [Tomitella biformata]